MAWVREAWTRPAFESAFFRRNGGSAARTHRTGGLRAGTGAHRPGRFRLCPSTLLADLQVLSDLDLTPLECRAPELTYLFKQIITQEVAYESLLDATRAMLHEQIGLYLERVYPDRLGEYLSLLAHHFERSQSEAKKREYLLKAGEAAQAAYANEAAAVHYQKVLPLLPPAEQVAVRLKLGRVLELTGQWDPAGEEYRLALALAPERAGCQRVPLPASTAARGRDVPHTGEPQA
jgi:tetratricopeptide (TPR) repeat protein